ncbi:MAG: carboxypeptidase M32 [Aggregatilineales bacterium]
MGERFNQLKDYLAELQNVNTAAGLLGWDQQVMMPPKGAQARAAQLGTLSRISHEMQTSDTLARLLDDVGAEIDGAAYDSDEASLLRVAEYDFEQATKIPTHLVVKLAQETILAHEVWAKARANNDYKSFQPTLEKIMDLTRQSAEALGYKDNPYDALINQYERGMTFAQIKEIFDGHRPQLVDLVAQISKNTDKVDDSPVHQDFDIAKQREFATWVIEKFGFDLEGGRIDEAVHPFANSTSINDVRITTRYNDDFLNPAMFGMMHEAGHGMYEAGVSQNLEGNILASGTSLGVHESQSRMWENLVGRSRGFWTWALPKLQETFPQLKGVTVDQFYGAVNKVQPSFIRVEADEATYNLHIMLRFELENDMLNGKINFSNLPNIWNERFESYLGIVPPTDTVGVLQDVHWSAGLIGYFATYALGNLLSVQYYNKAVQDHPTIPDEIASGEFSTLLGWLRENIHQHGRKFTSAELTKRVTGEQINSQPYITYLQEKFGGIYGL